MSSLMLSVLASWKLLAGLPLFWLPFPAELLLVSEVKTNLRSSLEKGLFSRRPLLLKKP